MNKSEQNIPQGYKQTEVGVIPEEWRVMRLGSLLSKIKGGGTPSKTIPEYWNGHIPWATVKDFSNFNNNKTQDSITEVGLLNSSSNLIQSGTLITATRMALGKACIYNIDVAINQDLKALYPNKNLDTKYLYYWFNQNQNFINSLGNGSTVMGISLTDLKSLKFITPPLPEQEKIADCLTTWDRSIEKLTALIKAKKQAKKGLMQQLLTGKKRLPGFTEAWKEVKLGEIAIKKSSTLQSGNLEISSGKYEVYGASGFITKIDSYDEPKPYIAIVKDGSGVGNLYLMSAMTSVLGTMDKIFPKNSNLYFLYGILKRLNFLKYKVGGAIPHIYFKDYQKEKVLVPSLKEQNAMAEILQTADKEITLLEAKLQATQQQKKGLMQVLLTGKKRLI